jgi:hypothetical protein
MRFRDSHLEAATLWNHYNETIPAKDRYTPLQCINQNMYNDGYWTGTSPDEQFV